MNYWGKLIRLYRERLEIEPDMIGLEFRKPELRKLELGELLLQPQRLSLHLKKNKHLLKYQILDYLSPDNQPIANKIESRIKTETEQKSMERERKEIKANHITIHRLCFNVELIIKIFKHISIKIMKQYIAIIFSPHLFKEQRKYRRYLTQLKHINSEFWDISHRIISIFSVFYLFIRHIITFTFSKLLTAINRLKKDYGEIRNEIPQYWPSSKYRKKRIFEPNHRINCLLQTQFCLRQTLSNFYSSYEFSVSRIC